MFGWEPPRSGLVQYIINFNAEEWLLMMVLVHIVE